MSAVDVAARGTSERRGEDGRSAKAPRFSVIVPLHRDGPTFRECLRGCLALDYDDFEVIVVSDREVDLPPPARLVITGHAGDSGPGEKRDAALRTASGDLFAFIDDDAFPRADWLRQALRAFADPRVGAVGGPGMTPPSSAFRERIGGAFYESWLGSGPHRYRFRPGRTRLVDDYPAYNLCIRRRAAEDVNGWGTGFYGGEDTVICLAMVRSGWDILYDPEVVVYHRRRPVLRAHLAQVGNVGKHRGYFVKRFPATSLRPSYFLPTAGSLALAAMTALAPVSSAVRSLLELSLVAYAVVALAVGVVEQRSLRLAGTLVPVTLASHIVYGFQFARGLALRRLDR